MRVSFIKAMNFKRLPILVGLVGFIGLAVSLLYSRGQFFGEVRSLFNGVMEPSEEEHVILVNKEFYLYTPEKSSQATGVTSESSNLEPKASALTSGEPLDTSMIDHMTKKVREQQMVNATANMRISRQSYCIGSMDYKQSFNWVCYGNLLVQLPGDLYPSPTSLRLLNTGIQNLTRRPFLNYMETIRDFTLEDSRDLRSIEAGTFANLTKLRLVYIIRAPKLISFDSALTGSLPNLTTIRIQQTGLRSWPNMSIFSKNLILTSIDLDNNKITSLGSEPIRIQTESLNLEFNLIRSIEEFTFSESKIGILSLAGNRLLTFIHKNAFSMLSNLMKLNLSSTGILLLPTGGLDQLRILIMMNTHSLKRIPSIYEFPMLEIARLTYSHHCCSFRYPQAHDPSGYEEHLRFQEEINALCESRRQEMAATGKYSPATQDSTSSTVSSDFEGFFGLEGNNEKTVNGAFSASSSTPSSSSATSNTLTTLNPALEFQVDSSWTPHSVQTSLANEPQQLELFNAAEQVSSLMQRAAATAETNTSRMFKKLLMHHNIECGELAFITHHEVSCTPEPDAYNPCEDIMGYPVLRVAVWFVVGAAVFGNLSVIVVHAGVFKRLSVPKFLQLNLAIGDLFMGVYLAMLATADLATGGSYFNYAIDWQYGFGCKIAGAISLFASQLSIFTLSVITFERYYTITYSIDLNMRLQLGRAARIMLLGWCYAFSCAILPIFANISSYAKTSICLPMRIDTQADRLFLTILLLLNTSAFVIIFACYLKMYLLILRQKTEASAKERTVAMRMALLVFTDFACWAPIIFYGATAIYGLPLISLTNSKILIVFFYPLNSMANPFLYVITTRQYRRDLNYLTSRWHVWRKNLFKRNNDSYYSNHSGALALAAAHANHAHLNLAQSVPIYSGSASASARNRPAARILCSRFQSNYTIRHQIITIGDNSLVDNPTGQLVSDHPQHLRAATSGSANLDSKLVQVSQQQQQQSDQLGSCSLFAPLCSDQVATGNEISELETDPNTSSICCLPDDQNLLSVCSAASTTTDATTSHQRHYPHQMSKQTRACPTCKNCYSCCRSSFSRADGTTTQLESEQNCQTKMAARSNSLAIPPDVRSVTQRMSLPGKPTAAAKDAPLTNLAKLAHSRLTQLTSSSLAADEKVASKRWAHRKCSCLAVDDIFKDSIPNCHMFPSNECLSHQKSNNMTKTGGDEHERLLQDTSDANCDRPGIIQTNQQTITTTVDILGNLSNNEATTSSFSTSSQALASNATPNDNLSKPHQCISCGHSNIESPSPKRKCKQLHNKRPSSQQTHHQPEQQQQQEESHKCLTHLYINSRYQAQGKISKRSKSSQDISTSSNSSLNMLLKQLQVERCKNKHHHHNEQLRHQFHSRKQHHCHHHHQHHHHRRYKRHHKNEYQQEQSKNLPKIDRKDSNMIQMIKSTNNSFITSTTRPKEPVTRLESILKTTPNHKEEVSESLQNRNQDEYYSIEHCFDAESSKDYLKYKREKKRVSIVTLN